MKMLKLREKRDLIMIIQVDPYLSLDVVDTKFIFVLWQFVLQRWTGYIFFLLFSLLHLSNSKCVSGCGIAA